jgi:hypothetical protein
MKTSRRQKNAPVDRNAIVGVTVKDNLDVRLQNVGRARPLVNEVLSLGVTHVVELVVAQHESIIAVVEQ